jgi:hypothetical protein
VIINLLFVIGLPCSSHLLLYEGEPLVNAYPRPSLYILEYLEIRKVWLRRQIAYVKIRTTIQARESGDHNGRDRAQISATNLAWQLFVFVFSLALSKNMTACGLTLGHDFSFFTPCQTAL